MQQLLQEAAQATPRCKGGRLSEASPSNPLSPVTSSNHSFQFPEDRRDVLFSSRITRSTTRSDDNQPRILRNITESRGIHEDSLTYAERYTNPADNFVESIADAKRIDVDTAKRHRRVVGRVRHGPDHWKGHSAPEKPYRGMSAEAEEISTRLDCTMIALSIQIVR